MERHYEYNVKLTVFINISIFRLHLFMMIGLKITLTMNSIRCVIEISKFYAVY